MSEPTGRVTRASKRTPIDRTSTEPSGIAAPSTAARKRNRTYTQQPEQPVQRPAAQTQAPEQNDAHPQLPNNVQKDQTQTDRSLPKPQRGKSTAEKRSQIQIASR